jgi:hypothetical protein
MPSKKPAEAGSKHQNVQLSLNYTAFQPRRLHFSRKRSRIVKLLNDAELCSVRLTGGIWKNSQKPSVRIVDIPAEI